jgi:hypothetical protein
MSAFINSEHVHLRALARDEWHAVSRFYSAFNKSGLVPRLIKMDGSDGLGAWHMVPRLCGFVPRLTKADSFRV